MKKIQNDEKLYFKRLISFYLIEIQNEEFEKADFENNFQFSSNIYNGCTFLHNISLGGYRFSELYFIEK